EELAKDVEKAGERISRTSGGKLESRAGEIREEVERFNKRVAELDKMEQKIKDKIKSLKEQDSGESAPNM
ncbi:MAG: hypothetical protein L0956_05270, partial [Candidatus Mariimomonas ferrooxydans]